MNMFFLSHKSRFPCCFPPRPRLQGYWQTSRILPEPQIVQKLKLISDYCLKSMMVHALDSVLLFCLVAVCKLNDAVCACVILCLKHDDNMETMEIWPTHSN